MFYNELASKYNYTLNSAIIFYKNVLLKVAMLNAMCVSICDDYFNSTINLLKRFSSRFYHKCVSKYCYILNNAITVQNINVFVV